MPNYSYWTTYIYGSGGSWVLDTAIRRPNESLTLDKLSTQGKVVLADGSYGYINPETKYTLEQLNFIWLADDGTLKTQLENYLENGDYLKIVTHTGETFIGRFIKVSRVWLSGIEDAYDLSVIMERMEDI